MTGKPRNNETAQLAGELAVDGAQPLRYNGYKVPLMRNLVARAIRGTVHRDDDLDRNSCERPDHEGTKSRGHWLS